MQMQTTASLVHDMLFKIHLSFADVSVRVACLDPRGKGKPPAKATAAVAQVHAMPAFEDGKVSWLWDTAAGRHLFGRQALTQEMRECASPSNSPVSFTTGGGAQQSADSLAFAGSELLEGEEFYILKECPPAQSIGKTVMDKGYMFIWDPREQVPYLIPPSIVPKCTSKTRLDYFLTNS